MSFKTLLQNHKISGYSLSKQTGISQAIISAWVNDIRDPLGMSLKSAQKICNVLNIDLRTLYDELSSL